MVVERIDDEGLQTFLPLLERRLTGVESDTFSLASFLSKVKQHFDVHSDHMQMLRDFLKSGYLLLFAVRIDGKYVGYTSCLVQPKPNFLLCYYVDEIWVADEYRKQGAASALLHAVEQEARNAGAWQIRLYVGEDNPAARRCYAKNGFQEGGDAIFCTKELDSIEGKA